VPTVDPTDRPSLPRAPEPREYRAADCVVFWKTDGPFGALSNMARGFPIRVGGVIVPSVEALYQALRFPHAPDIQRAVIASSNAWLAKRRAYLHVKQTRCDWERVRLRVMRWCIRLKLGHAPQRFGSVLLATGERPIVERSSRDAFWGATLHEGGQLIGVNALGRLLMELRDEFRKCGPSGFTVIQPPKVDSLRLLDKDIGVIQCEPIADLADGQHSLPIAIHPNQDVQAR
jgi:type I restriction enzyme S subunit